MPIREYKANECQVGLTDKPYTKLIPTETINQQEFVTIQIPYSAYIKLARFASIGRWCTMVIDLLYHQITENAECLEEDINSIKPSLIQIHDAIKTHFHACETKKD